jgi:hypothetical protein
MINLLPPADKKQLTAARTNTLLLRYVVLMGAFIVILSIEILAVIFLVSAEKSRNESVIADNTAKTAEYSATKQQADLFRTNLATAKYILGKQVPYTTLIMGLANNLPDGSAVDQLTIDPATFGTSTTLTIKTVSYEKSIEVKNALTNAKINGKPLFTSVSFQSVATSEAASNYPLTALYNVTYSKDILK